MEPCPSTLIKSDLKVWRNKLLDAINNDYPSDTIKENRDKVEELEYRLKIAEDYESNPLTKEPPFEEPKQFDIGFIPTVEQLNMAFQQMPSSWPGESYRHELKILVQTQDETYEKLLGILTFTKIDGQWVYFGPTKYK